MPPVIDKENCTGCGLCTQICPMQILRHYPDQSKTPGVKFPRECWHCNACVLDCPAKAISLDVPLNYMLAHVDAVTLKP